MDDYRLAHKTNIRKKMVHNLIDKVSSNFLTIRDAPPDFLVAPRW